MNYDLSVVVLCYKAESFIRTFVKQLQEELSNANINFEMVLVANYDSKNDRTPEIANDLALIYDNITVGAQVKEGKMGWDMRSGLRAATGDYIAIIDGDGQCR
ncbi:MAG: glycosyltransferase [Chitinophagales bacterium]